jgi:CheY-like chemotaxis protein
MKKEGGTLTIRLTQLKIGIENSLQSLNLKPGGYIHLEVKDTGHGMDKTTLNKIFTPYFTTKNKNEGTGLGLSVIHGLINSLGGNLTVFSELNKGAVFNIYLPTIESSSPQNTHIEQNILRGMEHILIVEDIDLILELERNMLENLGYRVTCFLNSIEAYEHFLKEPDSFDLVLTNLTMPFLNGTELAREIHDLQPDLPIILCTGFSEKLTDNLLQSLGVKDILKKPVIKKDLAKIIRKVLDERI